MEILKIFSDIIKEISKNEVHLTLNFKEIPTESSVVFKANPFGAQYPG